MNIARMIAPSLAALGLVCFAVAPGHAQVFSSGLPNQQGGNEATAFIQANAFDITSATDLESVEFWELEDLDAYQGSIAWTIYANNDGDPGAILASGDAASVSRTATGASGFGLTEFADTFSIGSVSLAAGDYWLGLHNGPLTTDTVAGFYWESATASGALAPGQQQLLATQGSFSSNGSAHAFTLSGVAPAAGTLSPASVAVPEPSTFALMGMGLFVIAFAARKRLRPAS